MNTRIIVDSTADLMREYQSARIAAAEYENIYVIDSGILVAFFKK